MHTQPFLRPIRRLPPPPPLATARSAVRVDEEDEIRQGVVYGGRPQVISRAALCHVFGDQLPIETTRLDRLVCTAIASDARLVIIDGTQVDRAARTIRTLRSEPATAAVRIVVLESRAARGSAKPLFVMAGADHVVDVSRGRFVLMARLATIAPSLIDKAA